MASTENGFSKTGSGPQTTSRKRMTAGIPNAYQGFVIQGARRRRAAADDRPWPASQSPITRTSAMMRSVRLIVPMTLVPMYHAVMSAGRTETLPTNASMIRLPSSRRMKISAKVAMRIPIADHSRARRR